MPIIFWILSLVGGTWFTGWGLFKTADKVKDLAKWGAVAGVIYLVATKGKHLKFLKGFIK